MLVAVPAAPIVPLDRLCASGTSYFGVPSTPYVPGVQGVGLVLEGPAGLAKGTPVWFATTAGMQPGDGSMRAVAAVPRIRRRRARPGADPLLVAALGLSAVAAWMALTFRGGLAAGERVLVLGAGGVVGQAAVQLARSAGAGRIVAAARGERARERALALGADVAVPLGDTDDMASWPTGCAWTARSTWSWTRCSAPRPPRHCACSARTGAWSTWAARPRRRPRSTRRPCAAAHCACSATPTTS